MLKNANELHVHKPANALYRLLYAGENPIETVSQFLKETQARGLSPETLRAYAFDLLAFYKFLAAKNLIIDRLQANDFVDFILSHRRQNAAPRTINRRLVVVRSFLNSQFDGLGDSLLKKYSSSFYKGRRNKALLGPTRIKGSLSKTLSVKVPTLVITPLTDIEIKKFLTGVRKYRDQVIVYLMLLCGLRSSEVLNLKLSDFDYIDNQIRVRGKGGKQRVIPLPPALVRSLNHYVDYERPNDLKHDKLIVVLQGKSHGEALSRDGLRALFRQRRLSTKLPRAKAHLLRHTFCTNLIRQGVSLPVAQKLMGHSDIEVTMQYVHSTIEDVAKEYHKAIIEMTKVL